jgi:hypothetical protein
MHSSSSLDPIQDDDVALAKVMLCGRLWQYILIMLLCIFVILKRNYVFTVNICHYLVCIHKYYVCLLSTYWFAFEKLTLMAHSIVPVIDILLIHFMKLTQPPKHLPYFTEAEGNGAVCWKHVSFYIFFANYIGTFTLILTTVHTYVGYIMTDFFKDLNIMIC